MNKIKAAPIALVLGALAVLTGCADSHGADGDPGVVQSRDEDHWVTKSGKTRIHHYDYDLTVQTPDGKTYDIDVGEDVYDHCFTGSKYPKCTKN